MTFACQLVSRCLGAYFQAAGTGLFSWRRVGVRMQGTEELDYTLKHSSQPSKSRKPDGLWVAWHFLKSLG